MQKAELDRERIEDLTTAILRAIRDNYVQGPESRDRALEALNALAACTGLVIQGCDGPGGEAHEFFNQALEQNLSQGPGE